MSIMAILATVTLSLVTSLFDSSIRTSKYLDQNTKIETLYGFFASRMASTNVGNIGLTKASDPTAIDPLTISGDQFIFTSNGGGSTTGSTICYRVMYFKNNVNGAKNFEAGSVWVAVASNCDEIRPTVGPNQSGAATSSDPVIGSAGVKKGSPFKLADSIQSTNPNSSTGPNLCGGPDIGGGSTQKSYTTPLVPFAFCNQVLSPLGVASEATPTATGNFYNLSGTTAAARLGEVRANQVTVYVGQQGGSASVPARQYTQVFSLAQVCAVETEVDLSLPDPEPWRLLGSGVDQIPFSSTAWTKSGSGVDPGIYYDSASKRVFFRGAIQRISGTAVPSQIFTLPAAEGTKRYRPEGTQRFLVPRGNGSSSNFATIQITSAGVVSLLSISGTAAATEPIFLDSISFRVST